jgi:hypothetical protein
MAVNLHKRRRNKPSIDDCAKASLEAIFEANAPDMEREINKSALSKVVYCQQKNFYDYTLFIRS